MLIFFNVNETDLKKQENNLEILGGAVPGLSKFLMGL